MANPPNFPRGGMSSAGSRYNDEGFRRSDGRKRILGYSRERQAGIGPYTSNLDTYYALNLRGSDGRPIHPAFNSRSPMMSAEQAASDVNRDGDQISPDGKAVPFGSPLASRGGMLTGGATTPPAAAPGWRPPMALPSTGYQVPKIFPQTQQAPASPVQAPAAPTAQSTIPTAGGGTGVLSFAERLARARQDMNEGRAMQQQQQQAFQSQFTNTPTGRVLNSPYGTGSSSSVRSGPATFEGATRDEFFGGAAQRQGVSNKYANAPASPAPRGFRPMSPAQRGAIESSFRRGLT